MSMTAASSAPPYTVRENSINSILGIIRAKDTTRIRPVEDAREQLATYSDSTIELIVKQTRNPNSRVRVMIAVINNTDERTVREVLSLHVHCHSMLAHRHKELIAVIRGLRQLERFKHRKLDELSGDDLKVAVAFVNITLALHRYIENSGLHVVDPDYTSTAAIHISDFTVQKFITDHHHRADELIAFLYQGRPDITQSTFSGLPNLRWYKRQNLADATEETIDAAISYLRLTEALQAFAEYEHIKLGGSERLFAHIDNPVLEDLIDQHPRKIDAIIDLIRERRSADIGVIREYLEDATALKNGRL